MTVPVSIEIGGHDFVCVPLDSADFRNSTSIFAVLSLAPNGGYRLLDVGLGNHHGISMDEPARRHSWVRNCEFKNVWIGILEMPSRDYSREDRLRCVQGLRLQYKPPCGDPT